MTVSTGNTLNTLDTLIALVTLFTVGNGEGGGSAVGVGDGVGIYQIACAGLFDFLNSFFYNRNELCVKCDITDERGTEIVRGSKCSIVIPTYKYLAGNSSWIGLGKLGNDRKIGFFITYTIVKSYVISLKNRAVGGKIDKIVTALCFIYTITLVANIVICKNFVKRCDSRFFITIYIIIKEAVVKDTLCADLFCKLRLIRILHHCINSFLGHTREGAAAEFCVSRCKQCHISTAGNCQRVCITCIYHSMHKPAANTIRQS